jgi:formate hydrogenlyase subunit 3/multisubunit Na+/H+ antiporter MnhD subunit
MAGESAYAFLAWSVLVLLAGGGLCYVLGQSASTRRAGGVVAAVVSLAALVLGSGVLGAGPAAEAGRSFGLFGMPIGADYLFRLPKFIGVLNLLVLTFGFLIALYSISYFGPAQAEGGARFHGMALWAVAGTSVALTTGNLLVFVFAWEFVTLMLYLMVSAGGGGARAGAAKTFAILGFSDAMIILGIAGLIAYTVGGGGRAGDALSMSWLEAHRIVPAAAPQVAIFLLLLIGALAKAGAFPVHTWLPAAAEQAPVPTMALLPASLDKLLGIVLLARISLGFFDLNAAVGLRIVLVVVGAVTIISAVMMAMTQHDLRRLLSFHAVSQVGYMVLGIGTAVPIGIAGGIFHMINHAMYKTLLFLGGGAVEKRAGELELDRLGGLSRAMPVTFTAFLIGSLAISGVPPLNGFASKWLVYQGVLGLSKEGGALGALMPLLLGAAVVGSALTLASFVKALHSVFLGQQPAEVRAKASELKEAPGAMLFPMCVLAVLCVALGLGASWVVAGFLSPAALTHAGLPVQGLGAGKGLAFDTGSWVPLTAVVLLLVGLVLGLAFYAVGRAFKIRRVTDFVGGEVTTPAPTHMSGTGFYLTVKRLPILRGFYADAERGAFDIYRLGGQYGLRVVEFLRGLHTGVLETYVTWVLAGAAAVVALVFALK